MSKLLAKKWIKDEWTWEGGKNLDLIFNTFLYICTFSDHLYVRNNYCHSILMNIGSIRMVESQLNIFESTKKCSK